jgi:hypothetical protein
LRTIVECDELIEGSNEALEVMSPQVSLAPREGTTQVVTEVPPIVLGRLRQSLGLDGYHLDLSVRLSEAEGNWLLSQFIPDRAESPEWECGSVENEELF